METLKETPVLKFNPNTLHEVRSLYDLDKPERIEEAIRLLKDWIKKQEHFTNKNFDRDYLERHVITNKGLMERCKSKLEKLCTFRTLLPEYFGYCDIKEITCNIPHYRDVMKDVLMTRLTPENYRVYLLKFENSKLYTPEITLAHIRRILLSWEYISKYDYSAGIIFIMDTSNCNIMDFISKFKPADIKKILTVLQEGYGMGIKAIHNLTNSKIIEVIFTILKSVLSGKLIERVHFHTTLESLHKMVPKEVLCEEYGGNEMPLEKLKDLWIDVLASQEHKDYMKYINEFRTDESRRTGELSDQYLPGSFRTLNVD